ncbi:MAG: acyl-CoA dehydrogenase C-terminal domain-containing protein, partial [Gammaproteobacteria bacterium]|nr:acyl-CoA dehydrogenase C-terminal domain-containing protein [Gammaproteobacteria bacterium]
VGGGGPTTEPSPAPRGGGAGGGRRRRGGPPPRLKAGDSDRDFLEAKQLTARFYAEHLMPRAGACLQAILAGSETLMALSEEQF